MARKKVVKEVKTVRKIVGPYDHYNVELIREGPLSGEYRFKTKGTDELGWQVSARDLAEAYETAERVPGNLRK